VTRDDVAAAAAEAVSSLDRAGRIYELTGPSTHSFDDIARMASRTFGMTIRYEPVAKTDYLMRA
jgi:NAD(P)H dehydrogenase (quinone)